MWQEYTISAVTLVLTASLLPTLRDPTARIPIETSALTAGGLLVKTLMFASLGMTSVAICAGIGCILWSAILYTKSGVRERIADIRRPSQHSTATAEYTVADD